MVATVFPPKAPQMVDILVDAPDRDLFRSVEVRLRALGSQKNLPSAAQLPAALRSYL
jgi:hypothetical protein